MIHVTFPDGAKRAYEPGVSGLDIAKSISPSLAKRTVAMVRDGELVDLADPIAEDVEPRIHLARRPARARAHPPRRGACDGRGGAVALAGRAGDDRPGDRERLLLRLLPLRAVHARGLPGDREAHARDHRARQAVLEDRRLARGGEEPLREEGRSLQGRADRRHPARSGGQALQPGRVDRPLPRPAHDLDRQDRRRVQADEGRRRLLARRFDQADAVAHLRDRLRQEGGARRLSQAARGGRAARPSQARARDGPVPLPGGGAGLDLLASEGLDPVPDAGRLHAPAPRRRLSGGQRAAGARQAALGDLRPLGLVSREHVHGPPGRRGRRERRTSASMRSSR